MSLLSTCYGADIDQLADVDGGFEAMVSEALAVFTLRQWTDVAQTLGFLTPLHSAIAAVRSMRGGLLNLHGVALGAFDTWLADRPRTLSDRLPPAVRSARARMRQEVLLGYAEVHPDDLWTLDAAAASLPGGACFERGPATFLSGRAFLDDTAPGYFHGNQSLKPVSACGWEGPVLLSLGTFPWVYGSRLTRTPPGLDWDASRPWVPAPMAMRLASSLWQPEGNLKQDARPIVFAYRHYREAAERTLRDVPSYKAGTAVPGRLYRQGLLLHAEQSSLELFTLTGPLGPLAANAHNYVIRRFSSFFALRRALLNARLTLPADQKKALADNPDPCVRPYAPKGLDLKLAP